MGITIEREDHSNMNTVIFDLDGTLLPMPNQEHFLNAYFKALSMKMIPHGLDPKVLTNAVWIGTKSMIDNDGTVTNEDKFWEEFCNVLGQEARQLEPIFSDFYSNEFGDAKSTTLTHPHAKECVRILKEKGYKIALATNPLFPRVATHTRIQWAGLNPEDFDLITTYENSTYCKPNLGYYQEVLANIDSKAQECIMIGNDVKEDMCAALLGIDTFLLKDCLICSEDDDLTNFRQGNFDDLLEMIKELPKLI
jgi:FMN phosphatase YigB (HAD superfamily)